MMRVEIADNLFVFGLFVCPLGCLGVHLANMQLRLATARFFLAFPNATVSDKEGMTDGDMEDKITITLSPMGQRCLIKLY